MATKTNDIISDVDIITSWLEKRNEDINIGQTDVHKNDMPVLARVICGGEKEIANLATEDRKKYEKFFKNNKKAIASLTLVGTGMIGTSIGSIASGIGAATAIAGLGSGIGTAAFATTSISGLSIAGMGASMFIPALWPIGISMLALGAGSIFKKTKDKKDRSDRAKKLEDIFNTSHEKAKKCAEKLKENNIAIRTIISKKLNKSIEVLSETSKKISINIDDALNADQNSRILQYQEIVLKQYNNQNEIRKMLSELTEAYNKLVAENEELAKKVAAYEANMKICGCTNNYIS